MPQADNGPRQPPRGNILTSASHFVSWQIPLTTLGIQCVEGLGHIKANSSQNMVSSTGMIDGLSVKSCGRVLVKDASRKAEEVHRLAGIDELQQPILTLLAPSRTMPISPSFLIRPHFHWPTHCSHSRTDEYAPERGE